MRTNATESIMSRISDENREFIFKKIIKSRTKFHIVKKKIQIQMVNGADRKELIKFRLLI